MLRNKLVELQEMWDDETTELEQKAGMFWRIDNPDGPLPFFRVDHIMESGVWFMYASPGDDSEIHITWEDLGL